MRIRTIKPEFGGFVYVLGDGCGRFKIGKTENVARRMKQLKIAFPFPVEMAALIYAEDAMAMERSLHEEFAAKRLDGEWFSLSEQDFQLLRLRTLWSAISAPVNAWEQVQGWRERGTVSETVFNLWRLAKPGNRPCHPDTRGVHG